MSWWDSPEGRERWRKCYSRSTSGDRSFPLAALKLKGRGRRSINSTAAASDKRYILPPGTLNDLPELGDAVKDHRLFMRLVLEDQPVVELTRGAIIFQQPRHRIGWTSVMLPGKSDPVINLCS